MPPLTKRWQIAPRLSSEADRCLQEYPALLRQMLYNRGHTTQEAARIYLAAETPPGTDPFGLLGMTAAADRLEWAIRRGESIAVYGDYDADGVTAAALLVQVLSARGAQARGYIPNRFDEGYGLNNEALENLHAEGAGLVVTVDCGIRSLAEADFARQLGLDLIISDHHHPAQELPQAVAIINPKQPNDLYPDKDLAGVGLAFKLAQALLRHGRKQEKSDASMLSELELLDLVALGTVADLAPLVGENRSLVRAGLMTMRQPRRQGLLSLILCSGLKTQSLTASDIAFVLGPRLNAAGRLDSALAAFTLLTTKDVFRAGQLAQLLDVQNRERQKITREIQAAAEQLALAESPDTLLLFAAHPDFNPGVVGLAASRLTDLYYRPAIVAQIGELYTRGSCRSIPEFHITEALDRCGQLLEHHGGHAAAAGFTVRNEKLPDLVEQLQSLASEQLSPLDLRPTLNADAEIPLAELKPEILEYLDWLQPTGYGNHQAAFVSRGLSVKSARAVGKESAHLKLAVTDGWITYDAIAFRQAHWLDNMPQAVDILYTFEKNEYNGRHSLQLNVRDLKPSGTQDR